MVPATSQTLLSNPNSERTEGMPQGISFFCKGEMMKIAVITGASGGLGLAFAHAAADLNTVDEIWLVARRRGPMEAFAASCRKACRIVAADLTDKDALDGISKLLAERKPEIRLLVNNAGVVEKKRFPEESIEELRSLLDLNVMAPVLLIRMCLPYMTKGTQIINIASVSAFAPFYDLPLYAASKRCLVHFGMALDAQLEERGITVLSVCPGNMETGMNSRAVQKEKKSRNRFIPYLDTASVARGALRAAARGKKMYTPGMFYKFFRVLSWILPDRLLLRLIRA